MLCPIGNRAKYKFKITDFASKCPSWVVQVGSLPPLTFAQHCLSLPPLTFAQHRLSPLAAFTSGVYFLYNGRRWQWICEFCIANFKGNKQWLVAHAIECLQMHFFFFSWTHDLLVSQKRTQRHFFSTLHPLSPVIFATAIVVAFVLLHNSRFNLHCYTRREAMPTQKSTRKWSCDLSRLLAWKITKGIHSCKPASLNCPIK